MFTSLRGQTWERIFSGVGVYCVTMSWQQIFKGSLQVTIKGVSPLVAFEHWCHQGRIKGGQRGQLLRAPRRKGAPRDEIYLFQTIYSFEKFRNSEAIQEYNSILYSYVEISIKRTRAPNSN